MKDLILIAIFISLAVCLSAQKDSLINLYGPYLGQELPDNKPVEFAPGLISTPGNNEFCASFSMDGREFYFNREMVIMVCVLNKDGWSSPEPSSFNGEYRNHEAHIAFDNKRLFFGSSRPPQSYGIWMTERAGTIWSEPQRLTDGMYVTSDENGNIYYGIESASGSMIVCSRYVDGRLSEPVIQDIQFAESTVTPSAKFHPAIAPDDSYIIFDNNEGLFVCYRQSGSSWSKAISLSEYLGQRKATIPSISPDGRFLFFAYQNDIYWVSTDVINKLRDQHSLKQK